ncbi:hypothetical protein PAMA_016005 [Pampus argenteus]
MALVHTGLLILLCCSTFSYTFGSVAGYGPIVKDPELEWARMKKAKGDEMALAPAPRAKFQEHWLRSGSSKGEAWKVPEYRIVSSAEDQKLLFEPAKGFRPLPYSVKQLLLVTAPPETAAGGPVEQKVVEVFCYLTAISVSVRKSIFTNKDASGYLKLGTCSVTETTADHYAFWYPLSAECGFTIKSGTNDLSISIVLSSKPPGPVVRDIAFEIPLQCKYPSCMMDGKLNLDSRFIPGNKKSQKFSVSAFIFKDMVSSASQSWKFYMHCEVSLASKTATEELKACNYNPTTTT